MRVFFLQHFFSLNTLHYNNKKMAEKILNIPKKAIAEFQKLPQLQQLIVAAVVIVGAWWLWKNYISKFIRNREGFDGPARVGGGAAPTGKRLVCTMYYTEWCPHCTAAKPEWAKLKQALDGKIVGGNEIVIAAVDCEKEKDKAEAAGVKGFPTFKFDFDGKAFTYSSPERTFDAFQKYINGIVGGGSV